MEYPDDASDHNDQTNIEYPDPDEVFYYPWQGSQQRPRAESSTASVIDPRLYKDLFPSSVSQQQAFDDDVDESSSIGPGGAPQPLDANDVSEESYEFSGQETSSEDESQDMDEDEDADEYDEPGRRGRLSGFGARGKGKRGPRKPLDPSPEFKHLQSEATSAFIERDYDRAIDLVQQAIQINPEIFAAHSLLSEIHLARGERDKALTALFSGAHTRPRDPKVWSTVAKMIQERSGPDRKAVLSDVIYCYSRLIDVDPKNLEARFERAEIYREARYNGRAATEYEKILKEVPHNARALRHLAETYIDLNDIKKAVDHYSRSVKYYLSLDPEETPDFSWSDINIYAELYAYQGQHHQGLRVIKSLGRWLLGRGDEVIWDDFDEDDREWDAEDSPRRIKTDGYVPKQWPRESYGLGLPLELRTKLGLFRLKMEHEDEALNHFEWLNPEDTSEDAQLYYYGDLFREVADALKEFGLVEDALRFYVPVQQTSEYADVSFYMSMGDCYMRLNKLEDAENCYLTVTEHDAGNVESRAQLAKLYENIGMTDHAFKYVNEAVLLERQETRSRRRGKDTRLDHLAREFRAAELAPEAEHLPAIDHPPESVPATTLTTGQAAAMGKKREAEGEGEDEDDRTENVQFLHSKMLQLQQKIKEGDTEAIEDWLDIADALLHDFRSNRIFYPVQRSVVFLGYSREARKSAGKHNKRHVMDEMREMAGRLQQSLGNVADEPLLDAIPTDYHGISFDEWLDMFLQYALLVAGQEEADEAYETLSAAAGASVWYHSKRSTRLIHVCWFTCALRMQDEETLAHEARWFIKEYQFVTDTYRLFSMLSCLAGDPQRPLFHSTPNMKFMLRQIKAMDYSLPDHITKSRQMKPSAYHERAALSTRNELGEEIPADSMDVALLVLYGHILYSGNSFYPALNYFFRAYALDPHNPAVLLSLALCYIHQSLKRQSENRHFLIMQGLAFMHEYRRVREAPGALPSERQEMEFNFARTFHMLGLAHLAVDGYRRVLGLGEVIQREAGARARAHANAQLVGGQKQSPSTDGQDVVMGEAEQSSTAPGLGFVEDFSREAAVALQSICALGGDLKAAKEVTERWLVI